jgi:spore maturation protein CgeB
MGHQVVHFESWDHSHYRDLADMNQRLLQIVDAERPDAMLVVQTNYEIWLETLYAIKSRGTVATLCWTTDDSWKYRQVSRFIAPAYHAITTTYPDKLPEYHRDGISHVLLTQWAAALPNLREPQPAAACRYKVSFVGAAHGKRKQRVARLRAKGIDVACFGHGWPSGPIAAEQIPEIMRNSVISLNFANSSGENQIKARTFEVPGAGGFLLTERAPHLEHWYISGKEIEVFDDDRELEEKILYYLTHPAERDAVAQAGHERTRSEHTYERRLQAALDFALQSRELAKANASSQMLPPFSHALQQHVLTWPLRLLRTGLVLACSSVWGRRRGPRAARRLCFELSWRLLGPRTFSAGGWTGRMFPNR